MVAVTRTVSGKNNTMLETSTNKKNLKDPWDVYSNNSKK
jgi:hypothetical protein